MLVKLSREEVFSMSYALGGRDEPSGDVYIKVGDISYIDGRFVKVGDTLFGCSDSGIEKILSALEVINWNYTLRTVREKSDL